MKTTASIILSYLLLSLFLATATAAVPVVGVTVSSGNLEEGGGSVTFTFTRSTSSSAGLNVYFSVPQASQVAGLVDVPDSFARRVILIPANATTVQATVSAVDDSINWGANSLTVQLKPTVTYAIDGAASSATVNLVDLVNADTAAPSTGWQGAFPAWRVQRLDLAMSASDWSALVNSGPGTPVPSYSGQFKHDDQVYRPARISWKDGEQKTAGNSRFSLRIDLNDLAGGQAWRGQEKLNLHAGKGNYDNLMNEGIAWYLHNQAAGVNGYAPNMASFVEVYVNNAFIGVFLSVEAFDDPFIKNRNLYRKNSTWMYKSAVASSKREFPSDSVPPAPPTPESPALVELGVGVLHSQPEMEGHFDIDSMLTLASVDSILGNHDDVLLGSEGNNSDRVDYYYPISRYPNIPPFTHKRSFHLPRDLDSFFPVAGCPDGFDDFFSNAQSSDHSFQSSPRFRQRFYEILKELASDRLSLGSIQGLISRMEFMLRERLEADAGQAFEEPCDSDPINPEMTFNYLRGWASSISQIVQNQLAAVLNPLPLRPQFNYLNNTLNISNPNSFGTIYYTTDGRDPWTVGNTVAPSAQVYSGAILLSGNRHVIARVRNTGKWSPATRETLLVPGSLSGLRITEIMSNPAVLSPSEIAAGYDLNDFEYLELKNGGATEIDLSDHYFVGITYTFPRGFRLAPGQFFVLVANPKAFEARYPNIPYDAVYWDGRLDNDGEFIALHAPDQTPIIATTFPNTPTSLRGFGFYFTENCGSSGWTRSQALKGTPGRDELGLVAQPHQPASAFSFTVGGAPCGTCQIEVSGDTATWSLLENRNVGSTTPFTVTDTAASSLARRYYRVQCGYAKSTNAVGYYDLVLPPGWSLIANQLFRPPNTFDSVFSQGPSDAQIMQYFPNGYTHYIFGSMSTEPPTWYTYSEGLPGGSQPLLPGQGVFFFNPLENNLALSFYGALPASPSTLTLAPGYNVVSSMYPKAASLTALNVPAADEDQVLRYTNFQISSQFIYWESAWLEYYTGEPVTIVPNVGEAFFYFNAGSTPKTWNQTFSVFPP